MLLFLPPLSPFLSVETNIFPAVEKDDSSNEEQDDGDGYCNNEERNMRVAILMAVSGVFHFLLLL